MTHITDILETAAFDESSIYDYSQEGDIYTDAHLKKILDFHKRRSENTKLPKKDRDNAKKCVRAIENEFKKRGLE